MMGEHTNQQDEKRLTHGCSIDGKRRWSGKVIKTQGIT
jgi:hypothetical protein